MAIRVHRRRFMAIVAALAVAGTGSVACGNNGDGDAGDGNVDDLVLDAHPPADDRGQREARSPSTRAANPNITIDYQTIPNNEFGTKMLTSLASGTGPDIINMDDTALRGEYFPKRLLAPVDPAAFGAVVARRARGPVRRRARSTARRTGRARSTACRASSTAPRSPSTPRTSPMRGSIPTTPLETWDDVVAAGQKLVAAGHTQAFSFLYLHSGWYSQQVQTLLHQTGGAIAERQRQERRLTRRGASRRCSSGWTSPAAPECRRPERHAPRERPCRSRTSRPGVQSMAILYPWSMDQIAGTNPDTYKRTRRSSRCRSSTREQARQPRVLLLLGGQQGQQGQSRGVEVRQLPVRALRGRSLTGT